MMTPRTLAFSLSALLMLGACAGDAPDLPDAYRDRLANALQAAEQGRNPIQACATVVGLAVGRSQIGGEKTDAMRAFELCYVDIPARYLRAKMAQDSSDSVCLSIASALVMSQASLGSFAERLGLDRATLDGKLKDRIADEVRRRCSGNADMILGTS